MIHMLRLERYRPVSVNKLLQRHWSRRSKLKKAEYTVVAGEAMRQGIAKAKGKRRVSIVCEGWPRGKMPDGDNLSKILLDALTTAGLLIDDSSEWCEMMPTVVRRAKRWETRITMEDL